MSTRMPPGRLRRRNADHRVSARLHAPGPDEQRERIPAFRALGTRVGEATAQLLEFFERFDEEKYGTDGGPLHDPNVIAWLLRPELYSGRKVNIEIETDSNLTMGMTVIDWWG